MAETAVYFVIDKLMSLLMSDQVGGQLTNEVNLLRGVHQEIEGIKDELESMRSFLKDAEQKIEKGGADSGVKTWVKQARELAFRIEDVIDEYMVHVGSDRDDHQLCLWREAPRLVRRLKARSDLASKIQEIKRLVQAMKERSDRYSLGSLGHGERPYNGVGTRDTTWHDPRLASLFVQEAELVGIEVPKNDLLGIILEDGEYRNVVVSVVGMGGLGKTTLSRKVYDDQRVVDTFDCQAWITVSQSYNAEELLRRIIKQFISAKWDGAFDGLETMEEVLLISKLREYLLGKRYMVVFDDVWEIDFWERTKIAFPNNGKGNRIMITTRNENVAPSSNESPFHRVYRLQPLPLHQAFQLFCKKAFPYEGKNCPTELEGLSRAFVERCEGLPLALVTIGSLLATKNKVVSEWQKLEDGLSSASATDQHLASDRRLSVISRVLSLSYLDLPYQLKSCFLYLGLFPEDYSIRCSRLIRLWIAEGFIRKGQGISLEEIAEEYLNELVCRSLVQVASVKADGKVRECRVHDLMRDVILSRSNELNLLQVSARSYKKIKGKGRHLSIYGAEKNFPGGSSGNFQTRTIILFEIHELPKAIRVSFFQNAKLLKSLDLEGAPLDSVPKELGNLWHLRYLSLKYTKVKMLPSTIGKLSNLETLDLRETLVLDLPKEINRLLQLRHLLAYSYHFDHMPNVSTLNGMRFQGSIGSLVDLQKLGYIEVDQGTGIIKDLGNLIQLRRLLIIKLRREDGYALCKTLEKLANLRRLNVSSINENEFLELESLSSPPPLLERLTLVGPLAKLPHWVTKSQTLVRLHFVWSKLGDDVMKVIKDLHGLLELRIYDGYNGKKLHFEKGSFARLKVLHLRNLTELNELIIEEGALPLLQVLRFGPSPLLKEMPLQFLRSLKRLELHDIHKKLALDMLPNGGRDNWRIKHVQAVLFFYRNRGRKYDTYKLGDPELIKHLETLD